MVTINVLHHLKWCLNGKSSVYNLSYRLCSSSSSKSHYDIVIAGGGMVGTTLACTLGKNGKLSDKKILLLEGLKDSKYSADKNYSNRVVALNPNTYNLLNSIGAWKHIEKVRFGTAKKLQVWDGLSDAMITFNNDNFEETVAYIVENDLLLDAAKKETLQLKNVTIEYGAKIKEYLLPHAEGKEVEIEMESGKRVSCDLLLGCDGANSKIRQTMKVHYLNWSYNEMAVVATLNLTEATNNFVAWQRFLPTGPIALLPLKDNLSSLVWTTTPQHAKELLQLSEEQFTDAVNSALYSEYVKPSVIDDVTRAVDGWLRNWGNPSNGVRQLPPGVASIVTASRASFPLAFGHAANYVAPSVALVGDAAHRVHPMAGQGVNLGFGDVTALNRLLGEAVYSGNKLGASMDLKQYETERQRHNLPTMLAIDGIQRLYNTDFTPAVLVRSIGLQIVNALAPLKKQFISQAAN